MSVSWMWAVLITAQWGLIRSGFPGGPVSKESAYNAGDPGSIPGSGRSPGEGNGNPLTNVAQRIPRTEEPVGYNPQGCKGRTLTW